MVKKKTLAIREMEVSFCGQSMNNDARGGAKYIPSLGGRVLLLKLLPCPLFCQFPLPPSFSSAPSSANFSLPLPPPISLLAPSSTNFSPNACPSKFPACTRGKSKVKRQKESRLVPHHSHTNLSLTLLLLPEATRISYSRKQTVLVLKCVHSHTSIRCK